MRSRGFREVEGKIEPGPVDIGACLAEYGREQARQRRDHAHTGSRMTHRVPYTEVCEAPPWWKLALGVALSPMWTVFGLYGVRDWCLSYRVSE
jgi:hypothetical protein